MPRITVHAIHADGEPRRWTLSERIVAENLDSDHYITQLIERLAWATADAEAQESRSDGRQSADMHPPATGRCPTATEAPSRPVRRGSARPTGRPGRGRSPERSVVTQEP
jgi:hypothetical protein